MKTQLVLLALLLLVQQGNSAPAPFPKPPRGKTPVPRGKTTGPQPTPTTVPKKVPVNGEGGHAEPFTTSAPAPESALELVLAADQLEEKARQTEIADEAQRYRTLAEAYRKRAAELSGETHAPTPTPTPSPELPSEDPTTH